MNQLEFEEFVEETIKEIRSKLVSKGKEYVRNNNPFHNFDVGARKKSTSANAVLAGMALKHEISIEDIINDLERGIIPGVNLVEEKCTDKIIYAILEKGLLIRLCKGRVKK